jgi:hypothetical protein
MKVLTRDKIVESFKFPISEALTFSILLWTIWGFVEAFYWQKLAEFFFPGAIHIQSYIYIASFLLYLLIASVIGIASFLIVKLAMALARHYEPYHFRGITLSLILAAFFFIVLGYYLPQHLWVSDWSKTVRYTITAVLIFLSVLLTLLFFLWASGVDFRIRRSGTMMLSVLILSLLLSFVHFPMFSGNSNDRRSSFPLRFSEIEGIQKLTASYCLNPFFPHLVPQENQKHE